MPRLQLKIAHKGLILVAVPLIFEIAFVVCLLQMLKAADFQATELTQSREVIACASELDKSLAYAGEALSSYKMTQSERLAKRYDDMVAESKKLCAHLTDLAKTREGIRPRVTRINEICTQIIQVTANFRRPQDSVMLMLGDKAASMRQLEHAYDALFDQTQALTAEEQTRLAGGSDSQNRSRATIYTLIYSAVLFNIALCFGLAVYFSKSITGRIGILTENTSRLARGGSLKEPVTGEDEIAALDRVFHKMANNLRDTERRKQDFVAMITHDLRTPLTSMRTITATLAEDALARNDAADCERVKVLERSLERMINLVNDLLDIDKIEAGLLLLDCQPTKFDEVLEQAIESVRHLAQQRDIKIQSTALDARAEIDSKRMGQILVNLVANAVKYSHRGASVVVEAKADNDKITVKIIDSGRGIAAEHLDQIFDRFKQVEKTDSTVRGGSGLGLSITKSLVELHHGTIGVNSSPGKGSTFWFEIPCRQPVTGRTQTV